MFPFQKYCAQQRVWDRNVTGVEEPSCLRKKESDGGDLMSWSSGSMAVKRSKSEEASVRHAVAERARRNRINTHITTLRHLLIPADANTKTVKATVLTETVRQVRELRRRAAEAAQRKDGEGGESWSFLFPGESDEATVSYCEEEAEGRTVKATVCCEDRPGLNRELTEAIRAVGATAVRAEMGTIGGRTKAELVVRLREGGGRAEEDVGLLRRSLKAVMENRAFCPSGLGQMVSVNGPSILGLEFHVNKRARICCSTENGWANRLPSKDY